MGKRLIVMSSLAIVGTLLLSTAILAGPLPPAGKLVEAPESDLAPVAVKWYLQNGAFDDQWDGDVPLFWKLYAGDADAYGPLDFLSPDAAGEVFDKAFVLQIINDEVKGDRNAYLYQEVRLPAGDYWVTVHSTIYAMDSSPSAYTSQGGYTYMTYYALVPKADAMSDSSFTPDTVSADHWKELWPYPAVCREDIRGWKIIGRSGYCDYIKRAETVTVAGGEYVFILRAELKWPDWRAVAYYIFDDLQIISATPFKDNWNACATSFCLEGLLKR